MQSPAVLFNTPAISGKSTSQCLRWYLLGRVVFHFPLPILLFLAALSLACKKDPPLEPPKQAVIALKAEDATCTEVWLKATTTQLPAAVRLLRDGHPVSVHGLRSPDSLLIDEGLHPRHTYTYQLQRLNADSSVAETSTSVQVTTMDTTSHNWVFDPPVLLGDGNSSVLYDVAIINDTLAYAVGEIYKRDSLENWDPLPYNLVKWDGREWHLKRVTVQTRYGLVTAPLEGIFAFSPTDIWVVATDPIHGDGNYWADYDIRTILGDNNLSVSRAWGSDSRNMYFVGRSGNIVHYNGSTWQRVASGTNIDIKDIWGARNTQTQQTEINCLASFGSQLPQARRLLQINGGAVTVLPDSGLPLNLNGIWFRPGSDNWLTGSGLYAKHGDLKSSTRWRAIYPGLPPYHTNSVRANDINDVFHAGAFGEILHFNGSSFVSYRATTGIAYGSYWGLAVKGNLVIAAGEDNPRAIVAIGKTN